MADRGPTTSLAALIADARGEWNGPVVESSVFGTADPAAIEALVVAWVKSHLGASVAQPLWSHASVGCAFGLSLDDGRDVVVKAHQPRFGLDYLTAVTATQRHLAKHWYPCPKPLGDPLPIDPAEPGRGWATASLVLAELPGTPPIETAVAVLTRLALELDASAHLGLDVDALSPHPLQTIGAGELWPEPYGPAIMFDRADSGAQWIDDYAAAARPVLDDDDRDRVLTHIDWSPRNIRGDRHGITAVYDMDSLALLSDARAAGGAAVSWLCDTSGEGAVLRLDDVEHFIWLYQRIRDQWFDADETKRVWASVLWNLAYLARCELAVGVELSGVKSLRALGPVLADRATGSA